MKAILISIKPQWVAKILNGEKTIETRKNKALASAIEKLIQEESYATIYVYCSKGKPYLHKITDIETKEKDFMLDNEKWYMANNGKVVCSFKCYKEENIFLNPKYNRFQSTFLNSLDLQTKSCLTEKELFAYFGNESGNCGYAIHISDLEIFDTPKELNRFGTLTNKCNGFRGGLKPLTKAPQNFAYVEIPNDN